MFDPINLPPSEHHSFSTGHSTEFGDSAKTVGEKINAGFKHVYSVLAGMGASLADEIEYVAKSEFDLAVHELGEVKAELANLKMMVQGLGFAGLRPEPLKLVSITDPSHSMTFSEPGATDLMHGGPVGVVVTVKPAGEPDSVLTIGNVAGAEPTVKVTEL